MIRSRLALAALLAALGVIPAALTVSPGPAPAAPVPAHLFPKKEVEPDYFPVRVGNTWVYQVENWCDLEPCSHESKDVIDKVEEVDGSQVVSIYTFCTFASSPGSSVSSYTLKIAPDGIFKIGTLGVRFDPPVCLLKRGSRSGDRWETNTRYHPLPLYPPEWSYNGSETRSVMVGKLEPVKVPAGTFQALRVEQAVRWSNWANTNDEVVWYASGIGVVKIESYRRLYPGQLPCTYSLKSFTPGKE